MNILRRLFGLDKPAPAEEIQEQVEESAAEHISIPGIEADVAVEANDSIEAAFGATRQLPPLESALSRGNQHIIYGQSTDVGMVRSNNQDAVLTFFASQGNVDNRPDFGLFIVADGMGGHHDGEKAAAIASQVLAEQVTNHIYLPILMNRSDETDADQPPISEVLSEAVKASNEIVVQAVPEGGTTITAAAIIGDLAYIVHVGDSRAYLATQGNGLEQITRDHSLVQRLIELDQLTPEEAAQHPQKNVLYRAIGQNDSLEVDAVTRRLPAGAYLMLCSDGLWNMVSEETANDIIFNAPSPQAACDQLVSAANERGGSDNISVVLLHIPD
jgi:serine/threonine protein phosphatase PrpC